VLGRPGAVEADLDEADLLALAVQVLDRLVRRLGAGPHRPLPEEIAEAGDERDRELSLLLTDRDKEKLFAIDEALEKLKEGSYGICEECGDKIGQGRLKVMPLAKYCVNCQSKIEKEMVLQKKVEEELKYRGLAYASNTEEEES
jgi:DnaK suppressor protein